MSRRTALALAAVTLLVGIAAGRFLLRPSSIWVPSTGPGDSQVVAVIDAEVPGTKVYHRGQLLGEVPVELTRGQLAALGLDRSRSDRAERPNHDGWGETVFFGQEDEDELKLHLQVPDAHADRFLAVETPWGRRTKMGPWEGPGGEEVPARLVAHFQKAETADGLRFRIHPPARVSRDQKTATVEMTCQNNGPAAVSGRSPDFFLLWGGSDTPWRRRVWLKDLPLPKEWEAIPPGDTVRATVEMEVPRVAGDYSVYAVLGFQGPADGKTKKPESTYSDSRLLRVR